MVISIADLGSGDNEKTSGFRDRIDYRETGWLLGKRAE